MDKLAKAKAKEELEKFKKPVYKISTGTTKKILDARGASEADKVWLNNYMANRISGECLPPSLLSNECFNIIQRLYGVGTQEFLEKIRYDWKQQNGLLPNDKSTP
jgi:hypothetical protein